MKQVLNIFALHKRFDFETSVKYAKDAGFDAIDYGFDYTGMEKGEGLFSGDDWEENAKEIRRIAEKNGLEIVQAHAPFRFGLTIGDEKAREEVIYPMIIRSIKCASIMGAKIIVVHPMHGLKAMGMTYDDPKLKEINIDLYKRLIPVCKEYGIKVATENMWDNDQRKYIITHSVCSKKEDFINYLDTINSEYIVGCLDIGHVGLPVQDDEAWDFIYAMGNKRIATLHIHDNDYIHDQHFPLLRGLVNWDKVMTALGEIDYKGDFIYELDIPEIKTCDARLVPSILKTIKETGDIMIEKIEKARKK